MKSSSLKEIAEVLKGGNFITLYPHENMDGDALGSTVALAKALRILGKEAWIYYVNEIPDNLVFLDKGYILRDEDKASKADIAMLIDCGDPSRVGKRKDVFLMAPTSICIDHHATSEATAMYNYIDPEEAATGQLIFQLVKDLGITGDKEIGEAVYTSIITDTGKFQYSNTQRKTHEIVAELYDWGINPNQVSMEIYESNRFQRMLIETIAMNNLKISQDGLFAMAFVTRDDLVKTGAQESETENVVGKIRSIKGVEVAAFLRENMDGRINVSLRSKKYIDVSRIAEGIGGGGHIRAAGATLSNIGLEDALALIERVVKEAF